MINLAAGKCVACRAGEPTLTDAEIEDLLLHIHQWEVKEVNGMKRLEIRLAKSCKRAKRYK